LWVAAENATIHQQPMLFLRYYLWIAPHLLLAFLLVVSLRRGLQNRLPVFFSYVVFELVEFVALFALNLLPAVSRAQYIRAYVFGLVVSTFLKFGIVYELCSDLLASHLSLTATLRPLMRWVAAVLVFVGALVAASLPGAGLQNVTDIFHVLQVSSNVVMVGLLIVLFLFTKFFRISWRSSATGVALGFGVFAAAEVATAALRAKFADPGNVIIDLLQMGAYHACVVIWVFYVALLKPAQDFVGAGLQKSDIQFWDQQLQRMEQR
jgi:hypothetical protein